MTTLIAVCGSDYDDPETSEHALRTAQQVGEQIAQHGAILICGGRGGIMEAACRGAKNKDGATIGIMPHSREEANPHVDVPLTTRLGDARNFILINCADAIIGIGGRWGTLSELSYAMSIGKPTIVIKGTGGTADMLAENIDGSWMDPYKLLIAGNAEEAVGMALKHIG